MAIDRVSKLKTTTKLEVFSPYIDKFYRYDIQGLRAISALMIMFYHIWFNRVSGGVDVFFVISGFLVTTSMLRGVAISGRVRPVEFITKIWRRVFPSAYLILIATLLLTMIFVPIPLWKHGINEFVASAAHVENLELMRLGTDYLDRENPPSQFQQFWALSIQMQFYVILLVIMWFLILLAKRSGTLLPLFFGVSSIGLISFGFSVFYTSSSPEEAYFHPGTRLWEFVAGVIIALAYPYLRRVTSALAMRAWNFLACAALIGLLSIGFWVDSDIDYPGIVSLAPVSCAVVMLLAGKVACQKSVANRLLSNRHLSYLGSFSFTVYLWHWPLLVFAQYFFGTTGLGLGAGFLVISLSVLLAAGTKRYVEEPMMKLPSRKTWISFVQQAGVALAVIVLGLLVRQGVIQVAENELPVTTSTQAFETTQIHNSADFSLRYLVSVDYDRPVGIKCLYTSCTGGTQSAEQTLLLVGDSHSAQWFDVLDRFGKREGFKVETRLNDDDISRALDETQPDVVVTVSTRTSLGSAESHESVRSLTSDLTRMTSGDTQIIGIRDNPRFDIYQNACVSENLDNVSACAMDRSKVYEDTNPADALEDQNANFHSVDLSDLFCSDEACPAVMEDTFIYYDKHHFSESFLIGITDSAIEELAAQAPAVFQQGLETD